MVKSGMVPFVPPATENLPHGVLVPIPIAPVVGKANAVVVAGSVP